MYRQNVKRQRNSEILPDSAKIDFASVSRYPYRLNFYDAPPQFEITIEDFEQWAIDRMKVLGEIESLLARNFTIKEIETSMKPVLDQYLPMSSNSVVAKSKQNVGASSPLSVGINQGPNSEFRFNDKLEEHRRLKDHYSHFILRLAFCRSEELSRRFVHAESVLFRIRLNAEDKQDVDEFIKTLNIPWEVASPEEKEQLRSLLEWSLVSDTFDNTPNKTLEKQNFFKVDFETVPDLVDDRRVVLYKGKAYVPMSFQTNFIISEFSANLTRALGNTKALLATLQDDRLEPLVDHFALGFENFSAYDARNASANLMAGSGDEISASMVDGLVSKHFPLCMQTIHRGLLATKHLRYEARREYGLFLKYIGLSVDEALKFWSTHFSSITEDKFNKEYRYNVRHQYGLEGSKINYKPLSCVSMAKSPFPAKGEYHGCPYKTFTPDNLRLSLERMGINDKQELAGISNYVSKQQYNLACTRVYALTHPADHNEQETISHPNQYFANSWNSAKQNKSQN